MRRIGAIMSTVARHVRRWRPYTQWSSDIAGHRDDMHGQPTSTRVGSVNCLLTWTAGRPTWRVLTSAWTHRGQNPTYFSAGQVQSWVGGANPGVPILDSVVSALEERFLQQWLTYIM